MRFFGKPKKSELEAAADFVITICTQAPSQWPSICVGLEPLEPLFGSYKENKMAAYEFALAVIAVHLRALSNLLPAEQSSRIRLHVLECLTTDEVGSYPTRAIADYDAAWDRSLQKPEMPLNGVASVLYDKLDLSSSLSVEGITFKDPILLMAVGAAIMECGGTWWKSYINQHRILP